MPPVTIMIKPASGLCNMRCTYCFYEDEMKNREQGSYGIMTEETLENVIRKTLSFAQRECTIMYQGGEPTLAGLDFFRKSIELQKKYNVNQVKIWNALQTNGYNVNDEWCNFFAENSFLIGLSVDGIKATHDAYRRDRSGQDTYFRILETAKRFREHRVEFNILTVVNNKTAPKIRKIYEQYRKQEFKYQQYIACLEPVQKQSGGLEYSLKPEVYGQFLIDLFELWELDLEKGVQPYIRQFENWIAVLMGKEPEACDQRGICGIQNIVEADGSVYPCDFYVLDDYCIGNLNHNSMEEIYDNRKQIHFLEDSNNHSEKCRSCKYYHICRGGCRRHRQFIPQVHDNRFCLSYQMFFDKHYASLVRITEALNRFQ